MKKFTVILITLLCLTASAYAEMPSEQQLTELKKFNIMVGDQNGELHLDEGLTRAEALKMVVAMEGISEFDPVFPKEPVFEDVTSYHWSYDYVRHAVNARIVNGDGLGYFRPDDEITNEELVKLIMCQLGYEPLAQSQGGYPSGYMTAAHSCGITDNLLLEYSAPAKRSDAAIMIWRALNAPLLVQTSYGKASEYKIDETRTMRKLFFENKD